MKQSAFDRWTTTNPFENEDWIDMEHEIIEPYCDCDEIRRSTCPIHGDKK
jgi:hypothetical protein